MQLNFALTKQQLAEIERLTTVLACDDTDVQVTPHAPDLPPEFVAVTIGIDKGRPRTFDISPEGVIL